MLFSQLTKSKIDLDDDLPLKKSLTMHNFNMIITSVLNQNQNLYYYNLFLGQFLYQLAKT